MRKLIALILALSVIHITLPFARAFAQQQTEDEHEYTPDPFAKDRLPAAQAKGIVKDTPAPGGDM